VAIFIINEWLWHDSLGDNGVEGQRRAVLVIECLAASEHQVVVMEGSAFDQKAWSACKGGPTVVSFIGRSFLGKIRLDSGRCIIIKPDAAVSLPEDLVATVKPDDHYLVRLLLSVPGSILVTTDQPLREVIRQSGLECLSREEFVSRHCN
jgi:hypothetical protein